MITLVKKMILLVFLINSAFAHARYINVFDQQGHGGGQVHTSVLKKMNISIPIFKKSIRTSSFFIGANSRVEANTTLSYGVKIAEDVHIGSGSFLGPDVKVGARTRIYERVIIGTSIEIGTDVEIHSAVLIERQSTIGDSSKLASCSRVGMGATIGKDVYLAERTKVTAGGYVGNGVHTTAEQTVIAIEQQIPDDTPAEVDEDCDTEECMICHENFISRVAFPCLHFGYCHVCITKCMQSTGKCAFCNTPMTEAIHYKDVHEKTYRP